MSAGSELPANLLWAAARSGESLEALARASGYTVRPVELPAAPAEVAHDAALRERWLQATAGHLGVEVEPIEATYAGAQAFVASCAPALLQIPADTTSEPAAILVVVRSNARYLTVLTPELRLRRIATRRVVAALLRVIEAPYHTTIASVLKRTAVPPEQHERVTAALLRQWLGSVPLTAGWLLRLPPSAPFWRQVRLAHLPAYSVALVLVYSIRQLLELAAWWLIGRSALQGYFDPAWLLAWALLLLSTIPFHLLAAWFQQLLSNGAGILMKQRLLFGAMQLDPSEVRHQGAGQFLGRVLESEAIEMVAMNGGFRVVFGGIRVVLAVSVLALGVAGVYHVAAYLGWVLLMLLLIWQSYRTSRDWTDTYRRMTSDLVERMVGHRTRLAQESKQTWHTDEDQMLAFYLRQSQQVDRLQLRLLTLIPAGWLLLGLLGIAWHFVQGTADPTLMAVSLGGVLLGAQALDSLTGGVQSALSALIAWQQAAPLFHAAARPQMQPALDAGLLARFSQPQPASNGNGDTTLLLGDDLYFRYPGRVQPVLHECNLRITPRARILLEGASGSGKSTLAALLTGLRRPDSGLLLLWGYDVQTVGIAEWRRRVVAAPQFHENYILTETLAFNLLMGRRWPPTPADLEEAMQVCAELGLADLLQRMPAGLQQTVGEGGWQLSHGERSRVFIARALLQHADLIILDESFAALDPENLQRALRCVQQRAPALLVIAHP